MTGNKRLDQTLKIFAKEGLKKGKEIVVEQHGADLPELHWQALTDVVQVVITDQPWVESIRRSVDGRDHFARLLVRPSSGELRRFISHLEAALVVMAVNVDVESYLRGAKTRKREPAPKKPPRMTKLEMFSRGIDLLIEDIENGYDIRLANLGLRSFIEPVKDKKKLLKLARAIRKAQN